MLVASCLGGLVGAGCSTANETLNTQLPVLTDSVEARLAEDELDAAEIVARGLERRAPGVDTFALLGRVLWRSGDLLQAEALFRRSADGAHPEGLLGLARAHLARNELDEAAGIAGRLVESRGVQARAHRLLAAVAWARGDRVATAASLEAAAEAEPNDREELDRQLAAILRAAPPGDHGTLWTGEAVTIRMEPDTGAVPARVDGRRVRLRLALLQERSSLDLGLTGSGDVAPTAEDERSVLAVGADLELGGLRVSGFPFLVAEQPEGIDGTLGFDLLGSASWSLDTDSRTLQLAPPTHHGVGTPPPVALQRTYFTAARIPRRALAAQLLLVPRIAGRVRTAGVDLLGPARIDGDAVPDDVAASGEEATLELRLGAWKESRSFRVADLMYLGAGGAVAPEAVLGREVFLEWRMHWRPGERVLTLERVEPEGE